MNPRIKIVNVENLKIEISKSTTITKNVEKNFSKLLYKPKNLYNFYILVFIVIIKSYLLVNNSSIFLVTPNSCTHNFPMANFTEKVFPFTHFFLLGEH